MSSEVPSAMVSRQVQEFLGEIEITLENDVGLPEETIDHLRNLLITITPPASSHRDDRHLPEFLTVDSLSGKTKSRKLVNVSLNWKSFWVKSPEIVVGTAAISSMQPWLILFGALCIAKMLFDLTEIELSHRHGIVMQAMWKQYAESQIIAEDEALITANGALKKAGFPQLNAEKFAEILNDLHKIGCLEIRDGNIRLIEKISRDLG